MSEDADRVIAEAGRKVEQFVSNLTGVGLIDAWAEAAAVLYKEQYAMKQNPYGEAWAPKPGDAKRTSSSWKFGKVTGKDAVSFSLRVARANAKRSCVPFEPRGLGRWREAFDKILSDRAAGLVGAVR